MSSVAPVHRRTGVLFIGGWGRSGSTLLDRMLGQLDGCVSVGELRELWIRGCLEDRRCGCGAAFSRCGFWRAVGEHAYGGWDRTLAEEMHRRGRELDAVTALGWLRRGAGPDLGTYGDRLAALYEAIAAVAGATTVVDSSKLANYAAVLNRLARLEVHMVHLVRDSRGVLRSWQKRVVRPDGDVGGSGGEGAATGGPDEMERYGVAGASVRYLAYNAMAGWVGRSGAGYQRVRYEDLVTAPRSTLACIALRAGITLSDDALTWLGAGQARLGPSHTVDGNPMRMVQGPVTLRVDDAWRRELSAGRRAAITTATLPLLVSYGYLPARAEVEAA